MANQARYGDANLNGLTGVDDVDYNNVSGYEDTRRRFTKQYGGGLQAIDSTVHQQFIFKEFTRESLANIQKRKLSNQQNKTKRHSVAFVDAAKQRPEPDPYLASGQQLPPSIMRQMPPELIGKPIEDIDPYYADKEVSVSRIDFCPMHLPLASKLLISSHLLPRARHS